MLENILGVPLNTIEEGFWNWQQIEVINESIERFLKIMNYLFPSLFGSIIKGNFVSFWDVTFNGPDVGNHSLECQAQ